MTETDLKKRARELVDHAAELAAQSSPTFQQHFPELGWLRDPETQGRWDFLMAIAAVTVAGIELVRLGQREGRDIKPVTRTLYKHLEAWHSEAKAVLTDLTQRLEPLLGSENEDQVVYAVGLWVLANAKQEEVASDETRAAAAVGVFLFNEFGQWWQ